MAADKKFNAASTSYETRVDLAERILSNMAIQAGGLGRTGMLLAGDPGVGKTSFIRFFARLTGLSLITVEAPHITEEHIINIPFIVVRAGTNHEQKVTTGGEVDADYKIVMSDSNLYTQITKEKKLSDSEYLSDIYKSGDKTLIKIFEELGGDEKTIPKLVDEVRKKFEMILFLDEYFRQTSTRIRNMLRTILNGKIGNHDLPKTAYVVYASNIHDEGVEGIPRNHEFFTVNMKHPPKDEWFAWLVNKYEKDEKHKLKDDVVQEFYKLLKDEDLNLKDVEADVRTSPRRWEQLLTYINSSLPVKNEEDAKSLLTNVKLSFRNYLTGEHAKLVDGVLDTVLKLIEKTSNIKMSAQVHGASAWRKTLKHQIERR
jgi:MoxR-like ATPase